MNEKLGSVLKCVADEVSRAQAKFKPYNSAHEGVSVIREEFEELWDEIKDNKRDGSVERQMKEALQVAATAIRFIHDLSPLSDVESELHYRRSR